MIIDIMTCKKIIDKSNIAKYNPDFLIAFFNRENDPEFKLAIKIKNLPPMYYAFNMHSLHDGVFNIWFEYRINKAYYFFKTLIEKELEKREVS